MDVAVVICTHQRLALLRQALASIARAAPPMRIRPRVLVVANACTDGTPAAVEAIARDYPWPLAVIEEPRIGKANALNTALARTDAGAVAFVDDDQRVDAGWLRALERGLLEHDEPLLCGRILPDWTGAEPAWVHDPSPWAIRPLPVPIQEWGEATRRIGPEERVPGGGNLVARREAVARIGPFRTDLGPTGHDLGGGEDIEWVRRGLRMGLALRYLPDLVQWHHVDPARLRLSYLMRKAYLRSRSAQSLHGCGGKGVPAFLWRKLAGNAWRAAVALHWPHTRHYLVRCAATLGEIAACRRAARSG